uniref:Uncharacterized protein n=1 Tax=Rhizophora mucronata TaxID=61149 RepID=A0A2P2J9H7_RHIMU
MNEDTTEHMHHKKQRQPMVLAHLHEMWGGEQVENLEMCWLLCWLKSFQMSWESHCQFHLAHCCQMEYLLMLLVCQWLQKYSSCQSRG